MKRKYAVAVLLALGLSANAYAQPTNFGFETGDTAGWAETYPDYAGEVSVVSHWSWEDVPEATDEGALAHIYKPSYDPVEGAYFAVLKTGAGSLDEKYTKLSQRFNLMGGDVLEGSASFFGPSEVGYPYEAENGNYNDYAFVTISRGSEVIAVPWYADSIDHGYLETTAPGVESGRSFNFGNLSWQDWSWSAPAPDYYTLTYLTAQGGDAVSNSYAFFDGPLGEATAVPEPATMAMLGLALGGITITRRFIA
jgi:hypothetical protein